MKNKNPILWKIEMHLRLISYISTLQDLSNDLKNTQVGQDLVPWTWAQLLEGWAAALLFLPSNHKMYFDLLELPIANYILYFVVVFYFGNGWHIKDDDHLIIPWWQISVNKLHEEESTENLVKSYTIHKENPIRN